MGAPAATSNHPHREPSATTNAPLPARHSAIFTELPERTVRPSPVILGQIVPP
jgi:hypothetical protein